MIERLAGRAVSVSVASHDASLVRQAARLLRASGTSAELELLPGFPLRRVLAAGREFWLPVRMFVPYGFPYIPYSPGQVARRPIILWWLVRDALRKRHPESI